MHSDRRNVLRLIGLGLLGAALPHAAAGQDEADGAFATVRGADDVAAIAKALATRAFEPPKRVARRFAEMDFSGFWGIRQKPSARLWAGLDLPFRVGMFHAGGLFKHAVGLYEIGPEGTRRIAFRQEAFSYSQSPPTAEEAAALGFAGFNLYSRLNPDRDMAAFLGASYFRAVGGSLQYGLSARGLAIDTTRFGEEEFPRFRAFWLVTPAQGDDAVTVLALLDSAGTTGAYRFVIRPGASTVIDVDVTVYPRRALEGVGLAPITSMYLHGENDHRGRDDFRPEVHDSDGLAVLTGAGEWLWRPLVNPIAPRVNDFVDHDPRGFGLVQRDRDFRHYLDDGVYYDRRPDLWIEPRGGWGAGSVELVELPAEDETVDNVVVYWRPVAVPEPGRPLRLGYRMHWGAEMPARMAGPARAVASSTGIGGIPGQRRDPKVRKFVVDFAGGDLALLAPDAEVVPGIEVAGGSIEAPAARPIAELGGWRANFDVRPGKGPISLRLFLSSSGRALTETWTLQYHPEDI